MIDSMTDRGAIVVGDKTFIPYLSEEAIRGRISELAADISRDYEGRDPLLVCVLNGAFMFFSDLVRQLRIESTQDFLKPSSYGDGMDTSGTVVLRKDIETDIRGRHVILVEDIVDTGLTLSYLRRLLLSREPASLAIATLLSKPAKAIDHHELTYVGFEIPPVFVIGYGLDYGQRARSLPGVYILAPENGNGSTKETE